MSELQAKIRRYKRMKSELPRLERQIMQEAKVVLFDQGHRAVPRIERVLEQFG